MNKGSSISKSIKEGKWLNIHYQQENEITTFWAAIKEINISNKVLTISMFNDKKSLNVIKDAYIYFDKISAIPLIPEVIILDFSLLTKHVIEIAYNIHDKNK